jgi:CBS domain-containing protein
MGEKKQVIEADEEGKQIREFTRRLLQDLRAMERMLTDSLFETGVRRAGAEQEVFLVDRDWRPAPAVLPLLERLQDSHYTTEVAQFNLEMNLDPVPIGGDFLSSLQGQLDHLLGKARRAAAELDARVVMTGILPTIRKSDLGLDNMTPIPRYYALNRAMTRLRGTDYEIHLKGTDEVYLKHDSVMVESCNCSFQAHLQVSPTEFARLYNISQVVAGPVLAAATNSPLLFGKRLWQETRIALFQQSVDTRKRGNYMREVSPRVDFGSRWLRDSVVELFQEGISRHRILIATDPEENPFEKIDRGLAPELRALRLHNGTIYKWNRACYGIVDGRPHLRIEARALPSGPTVVDEIANAAFWYGLMLAMAASVDDVSSRIAFDDAKQNFFGAARQGLGAQFTWLDGYSAPAQPLILERLLPMAREGLLSVKTSTADVDRYLGIVEERVRTGMTGSRWILRSLAAMQEHGTEGERLNALTAATVARQATGEPITRWELARLEEGGGWRHNYVKVEQFMSTDFVSVHENDALDLVVNLMIWEKVRHVPVEDEQGHLVGLVSYRAVLRAIAKMHDPKAAPIAVREVMIKDPWTISPEASTFRAIEVMRKHQIGSLPVVKDGRIVGMVHARNFMAIAGELLEEKLRQ